MIVNGDFDIMWSKTLAFIWRKYTSIFQYNQNILGDESFSKLKSPCNKAHMQPVSGQ